MKNKNFEIEDSEKWWDSTGKDILRNRQFSGSKKDQQQALDATNPNHANYIGNSGILKGLDWNLLSPSEQHRVVKAYSLSLKNESD